MKYFSGQFVKAGGITCNRSWPCVVCDGVSANVMISDWKLDESESALMVLKKASTKSCEQCGAKF